MTMKDIKDVPTNMHTHTVRCKHAEGEEYEYVEKAIEAGYKILGFSDHSPYILLDGRTSRIRMDMWELEGYVDSIESLKDRYKDDITIYTGLEMEYFPLTFDETYEKISGYPLDYFILGQHFLENEGSYSYVGQLTNDEKRLEQYVDNILEGLKKDIFLYVAHPDLINFAGDNEVFNRHMNRLLMEFERRNMPTEVNLGGLGIDRWYPSERMMKLAANAECQFIIGVDAHEPKELVDYDLYDRAYEWITNLNGKVVKGRYLSQR